MADNVIRVPRPSRSSYDPNRPLAKNTLLLSHVRHLHHAEMLLPRAQRTGIDIHDIKTEGQAAEYIKQVTLRLHPQDMKTGKAT